MAVAGGRRNIPDRAVISTAAATLTVCVGMKNRTSADAPAGASLMTAWA
jgi:hypothetical protein